MEHPIVDQMVASPSGSDLSCALKPRLGRLVSLDHRSWMNQLAADGFSSQDIEKLEALVASLIDVRRLEDLLANSFRETVDLSDQSKLTAVLNEWSGKIARADIWPTVCHAGFPDPIDAIAFVARTIFSIASSVLALETMKRDPLAETSPDFDLDPGSLHDGIALAEQGIEEDMATWPAY
jgi:hypothetical protein